MDGKLEAVSPKYVADNHRATSQKPDNAFTVDLDAEKGRKPRDDKDKDKNTHRVAIKFAKKIRLETVRAYLEGKIDFDNGVLEGISKRLPLSTGNCTADTVQISLTIYFVNHRRRD